MVNDRNKLIGIISSTDGSGLSENRCHNLPSSNLTVEGHRVKNVETIVANMNIFDTANRFFERRAQTFSNIGKWKVGRLNFPERHIKGCLKSLKRK